MYHIFNLLLSRGNCQVWSKTIIGMIEG